MRYFIFVILGIFSSSLLASVNVDLYHTQVTLQEGQSEHDAEVTGLENVIIKASGNVSAAQNVVIKKALSNVSHYLTELGHDKNSDNQTIVKLGFNGKHIRELLTQAQLPFWPASRTNILIWYIKDDGYQRSIAWENVGSDEVKWIKQSAELRGLPLTVPVGDFTDIMNVEVSDLWGGFLKPISEASSRYQPDAVLVVRAQDNRIRWTLYDQSPKQIIKDSSSPLIGSVALSGENGIKAVVDDIARYYARKNGILISAQTSESSVEVEFSNLKNAMDFFTLENDLKGLSSVASIDVTQVSGERVLYTVHILTSVENFEQELSKNHHLIKIGSPGSESVPNLQEDASGVLKTSSESVMATEVVSGSGDASPAQPESGILRYEWQ
ncbi:DUF2066 domain-containing protein [Vibrio salinus]|uniref:DUF2066 domain-containing protein n=1 Tax=Vibrio salinus TaxID=2899784 RepID=UPI001E3738A5|nr:DUF2066 domain-containing protein [Vibrio salinus]MCE0494467.1 DUF2066 domain-containing protein [Vibrio salinus]